MAKENFEEKNIAGWGNRPCINARCFRPEKRRQIDSFHTHEYTNFIARGAGTSYGDASLSSTVLLTERLNRFLAFDKAAGTLRAEAGVTLAEIMNVTMPEGWLLPVIPGTKFATIGGAVACNVHGKNHYRQSELGRHITEIVLKLPDGSRLECSRNKNTDLFSATIAGLGLTGIIEEVALQLIKVPSSYLRVSTERVAKLESMLACFEDTKNSKEFRVGWIEPGGAFMEGFKGVFQSAVFETENIPPGSSTTLYQKPMIDVPFTPPFALLNKPSIKLFHNARFRRVKENRIESVINAEKFFHPLDSVGHWNRLYGKKGLVQYQCLIPEGLNNSSYIRKLFEMLHLSGHYPFLCVIKHHGVTDESQGLLTFSKPGYSLALDFPSSKSLLKTLEAIDEWLCSVGGRVYLAKDVRLSPLHFSRMYGEKLSRFQTILHNIDPNMRMHSLLAERLMMHGPMKHYAKQNAAEKV